MARAQREVELPQREVARDQRAAAAEQAALAREQRRAKGVRREAALAQWAEVQAQARVQAASLGAGRSEPEVTERAPQIYRGVGWAGEQGGRRSGGGRCLKRWRKALEPMKVADEMQGRDGWQDGVCVIGENRG